MPRLKAQPKPVSQPIKVGDLLFKVRHPYSPTQSRRLTSDGLIPYYPLRVERDLMFDRYIFDVLAIHNSHLNRGDDRFALVLRWGKTVQIEVKPLERLRRLQDSCWRKGFWKELGDRAETYDPTKHINTGYISGDGLAYTQLQAIVEV